MGNLRKHRDIKLVTTNKKREKILSEPNYHTTKWFSENLIAIEMNKTKVRMNKPIYLGFSILDLSKIIIYEFWYDYIKLKYGTKAKLCYMDTDSFFIHIETEDFYKDIACDVENRFDSSNYVCNGPFSIGKNKNFIGLMKDKLGGNILKKFAALRTKTYFYLMDDVNTNKKSKGNKKCIIKRIFTFNDYKNCLTNKKSHIKITTKI